MQRAKRVGRGILMGGVPGGTGVLVVDLFLEQHRWFAKQGFEHVVHPPLGQELMQGRVILGEVFGSCFDPATASWAPRNTPS